MYKGIYLPSLSGRLQDARLEAAYQKYSHRQRQKSLVLVNSADVLLKVIMLLKVACVLDDIGQDGNSSGSEEDNYASGYYDALNGSSRDYVTDEGTSEDDLLLTRTCYLVSPEGFVGLLAWLSAAAFLNLLLGLVTWWRCYANNFLHWGALATWVLLLVQGECMSNFVPPKKSHDILFWQDLQGTVSNVAYTTQQKTLLFW